MRPRTSPATIAASSHTRKHLHVHRLLQLGTAVAGCCAVLAVSACGAQVGDEAGDDAAVNVTNCGQTQTYPTPQKAVAYDVSAIEKMFSLGLADRMRGIVMPATATSAIAKSPYAEDYSAVETISDDVLGQEAVVSAEADWVFAGWNAGFSEERGITPESLKKLGISAYMQEETCFNYGQKGQKTPPLEATYKDLENLGTIFGVEDRATALIEDLRSREKKLADRAETITDKPSVFVYDSGTTEPYTSGNQTAPQPIIDLAGGRNVTENLDSRWDTIGWETAVKENPDVIMVVDYNKQPVEEKLTYLKEESPLRDSTAVRDDRIYVIDYGEAVSSPRNIDAAEKLAAYLHDS